MYVYGCWEDAIRRRDMKDGWMERCSGDLGGPLLKDGTWTGNNLVKCIKGTTELRHYISRILGYVIDQWDIFVEHQNRSRSERIPAQIETLERKTPLYRS